jgi:hypothetical protein
MTVDQKPNAMVITKNLSVLFLRGPSAALGRAARKNIPTGTERGQRSRHQQIFPLPEAP